MAAVTESLSVLNSCFFLSHATRTSSDAAACLSDKPGTKQHCTTVTMKNIKFSSTPYYIYCHYIQIENAFVEQGLHCCSNGFSFHLDPARDHFSKTKLKKGSRLFGLVCRIQGRLQLDKEWDDFFSFCTQKNPTIIICWFGLKFVLNI